MLLRRSPAHKQSVQQGEQRLWNSNTDRQQTDGERGGVWHLKRYSTCTHKVQFSKSRMGRKRGANCLERKGVSIWIRPIL